MVPVNLPSLSLNPATLPKYWPWKANKSQTLDFYVGESFYKISSFHFESLTKAAINLFGGGIWNIGFSLSLKEIEFTTEKS